MKTYLYDPETRIFTGESRATPGDVPDSWFHPSNATSDAPPETPPGKLARWNGMAWEFVDAPTPAEQRRAAYEVEADPLYQQGLHYMIEAAGLEILLGNDKAAAYVSATAKAEEYLRKYAETKAAIRERFPDGDPGEPTLPPAEQEEEPEYQYMDPLFESAAPEPVAEPAPAEEVYALSTNGIYHRPDCKHAAGDRLALDEIAKANPEARPCAKCKPPELPAPEGEE